MINSSQEYRCSNDAITMWIIDHCKPCDDVNPFSNLYSAFSDWYDDENTHPKNKPQKKEIKNALIKWQDKSKWGLVVGKEKADNQPNGTMRNPKFNLIPMIE